MGRAVGYIQEGNGFVFVVYLTKESTLNRGNYKHDLDNRIFNNLSYNKQIILFFAHYMIGWQISRVEICNLVTIHEIIHLAKPCIFLYWVCNFALAWFTLSRPPMRMARCR